MGVVWGGRSLRAYIKGSDIKQSIESRVEEKDYIAYIDVEVDFKYKEVVVLKREDWVWIS